MMYGQKNIKLHILVTIVLKYITAEYF